jgi:hypothetical protein
MAEEGAGGMDSVVEVLDLIVRKWLIVETQT